MVLLDGNRLTLSDFHAVVFDRQEVGLDTAARKLMEKSRAHVEKAIATGERIYSINTGFGVLSKVKIPPESLDELQVNLIRSHSVGIGPLHSEAESRGLLLLRANVLAKGFSGVRPLIVETLCQMLNKKVHPAIPMKGSVGASGDLAPLAHLALVLIGEGEVVHDDKKSSGAEAMQRAGIAPVKLLPKEGLSLINGTQQMTALGAILISRAEALVQEADLICSASLDGTLGTSAAFAAWLHEARPQVGQLKSAANLAKFCVESEVSASHATCEKVQDAYSFRCTPQVHGACRDLLSSARRTIEIELNSATDNPLVNPATGEIVSGGNFHGQPVAFALDIIGMAVSEISSISERRISKLMDPNFSELPAFLVKNEGLNSGLMMAQVTAASLVSENKLLTHPASTDSIPTNNEKEDHVSMGPWAARKAKMILENSEYVLAIEAIAACQALEFRKPLKPNRGARLLTTWIRSMVPPLEKDRILSPDVEAIAAGLRKGELDRKIAKEFA